MGPQGPRGPDGVSGYTVVAPAVFPSEMINFWSSMPYTVACPAGTRPLGGGFDTGSSGSGLSLTASHPQFDATTGIWSWRIQLRNNTDAPITTIVRVHAICAAIAGS